MEKAAIFVAVKTCKKFHGDRSMLGLFISLNFQGPKCLSLRQCKPGANSRWELMVADAVGKVAVESGRLAGPLQSLRDHLEEAILY